MNRLLLAKMQTAEDILKRFNKEVLKILQEGEVDKKCTHIQKKMDIKKYQKT